MDFKFHDETVPPPRSAFVNTLAWIFIIFAGFATVTGLLQNIMIWTVFPKEQMSLAMQQAEKAPHFPPVMQFMFSHFDLFFLCFLLVSVTALVAAIGLLKRKNWARLAFIALMSLGVVWNVAGLAVQFSLLEQMPELSGQAVPAEFAAMMRIMQVVSVVMVLAFCALFVWLIRKLLSAPIRAEFD